MKVYEEGEQNWDSFLNEVELLTKLQMSGVASMIESKENARVKVQGGEEYARPIIVLEYA